MVDEVKAVNSLFQLVHKLQGLGGVLLHLVLDERTLSKIFTIDALDKLKVFSTTLLVYDLWKIRSYIL